MTESPMTPAPKRRWFAFSLRTLFAVVTVFGLLFGWILWNVDQVRQRERATQFVVANNGEIVLGISDRPWKSLPIMWTLLGAKPVKYVKLGTGWFSYEDREHLLLLFPEAQVSDPPPRQGR